MHPDMLSTIINTILEDEPKEETDMKKLAIEIDPVALEKSIPLDAVFSKKSMQDFMRAIQSDFIEGVMDGWSSKYSVDYDHDTYIGGLKLDRDALDYAIYASELNLYDFMQEFGDYLYTPEHEAEYAKALDQINSAEVTINWHK